MNKPEMHNRSRERIARTVFGGRAVDKRSEGWTATPFSPRPYYPFALGNGSECVTVDHSGSMLACVDGHAHKEQHQGLIPGWYKNIHRVFHIAPRVANSSRFPSRTGFATPCLQAGYTVRIDGENVEPSDFCQSFDAKQAVLTTDLVIQDARWRITAYLTTEHLWVEHHHVLSIPHGRKAELVFFAQPFCASFLAGVELARQSVLDFTRPAKSGAVVFDYELAPNKFGGRGIMWATPNGKCKGAEIVYTNVKAGFKATRYIMLVDNREPTPASGGPERSYKRFKLCSERRIRAAHAGAWLKYSAQSGIQVPDSAAQGLFDLSMYWMRANQYPDTGSLNLGPFPCHWGGGANAIWDAGSMQIPLLHGNHLKASRKLLDYYRQRLPRARQVARALGLPGARLTFFASAGGEDAHRDPERVRTEKIAANATAALSFYDHWRIAGRDEALKLDIGVMRELLEHVVAAAVREDGAQAYIVDAAGAAEGRCPVSNDSFLAATVARALRGYCAMAAVAGVDALEKYNALSLKLTRGLRGNFQSGILMADRQGAQGCVNPLHALNNLPESLHADFTPKTLQCWVKQTRTAWGFDKPQKNYRDWPWCHCWLSVIYSHWGWSSQAFEELQLAMKDCSSLGAMPEKIRLDGYAINYWYTSTHAAYLWAFQAALCHDRTDDELGLLMGMDGAWRDIQFDDLRMNGGLLVSLETKNSRLRRLVLRNNGVRPVRRKLVLNPCYAGKLPEYVCLASGETMVVL